MSLSNIGKKFLELKQRTTRDYNFADTVQHRDSLYTDVGQQEYNLSFAVPILNKKQFKLFVDGKLKSEGATKDFTFVNIVNGVSSRIRLNVVPVSVVIIEYELSGIKSAPLPNAASIIAQIENEKNPVGAIITYASSIIPAGYLLCDGSPISQVVYASLFAKIGTLYNTGSEPVGTFRVPDFRGKFLRGLGGTAPFASAALGTTQADATAMNGLSSNPTSAQPSTPNTSAVSVAHTHGGTTGDNITGHTHGVEASGSDSVDDGTNAVVANNTAKQTGGESAPHKHNFTTSTISSTSHSHPMSHTHTVEISSTDLETRPINMAVNFIIKY